MTISIAMATYNGAAHLQEQLDSLAAQTRLPHELVIGDDGSTDDTLAIARRFAERAPFAVTVHANAQRLGYADNFLATAGRCSGDWIAFCDQDDVWLPHKLAAVAARCGGDTLLVLHSADLTDGALRRTGRRFPDLGASRRVAALHNRPWWTPSGFTQCVAGHLLRNFDWRERPRDFNYPDRPQAHDQWTYFLANSLGAIAYIQESLALYRRHDAAVTGRYDSSLGDRLQHIRAAGHDYYASLAAIAGEYAQTLRRLAPGDSAYARESAAAQAYYAGLRDTYGLRAELHSDAPAARRLRAFAGLCRRGAYAGAGGKGLGMKAFVKDVAALA